MARGPAGTSPGRRPQLLPLLPLLLLLLRDAGGSHPAPAWSASPAASDGLAGIKDPWRSLGDAATTLGPGAQDMVAVHMLRLYEKYSRRGARPGGGNTVRSFRARLVVDQKAVYFFNLTSMQDSEMILAATFHFYAEPRWPRAREAPCKQRAKNVSCRLLPLGLPARQHLLFRSLSQNTATQGLLRGAMALAPPPRGLWQAKDISPIVKAARQDGELILSAQLDPGEKAPGGSRPSPHAPYILVYADDLAISEPNSVAVTLQRYDPFQAGDPEPGAAPNSSADPRVRRATQATGPLQDNELPGLDERPAHASHAQHYHKHELWPGPFRALKPRPGRKDRRKKGPDVFVGSSRVLDFDEKTMQKARRKQWAEPRVCSRRYLKVDFADIGWNEWIILPKSFDAYYCAGVCEFPMPKMVRPSNHATIQSIVRAVGIVPGIPEPCCVPDKMNSLGVLFLDENRNVVLKVYPNMSVETCACR
ncbi:growth/differentiation factor 10 isoform X1 [Felis catus]|uniref:growth/differentiation factor 10 isoform X1 n=1 Tax=Felis catus TaxID=9685 RepID=UPI00094841A8|nr:growth/differentiation factor 10 isoform X1 [Felis catus]